MLETVKKSLGFNNTDIYFKQTSIFYKELVFCFSQILKDIIAKYTLFYFFFDEAVNPPTIEIYIDPAVF